MNLDKNLNPGDSIYLVFLSTNDNGLYEYKIEDTVIQNKKYPYMDLHIGPTYLDQTNGPSHDFVEVADYDRCEIDFQLNDNSYISRISVYSDGDFSESIVSNISSTLKKVFVNKEEAIRYVEDAINKDLEKCNEEILKLRNQIEKYKEIRNSLKS